MRGLRTERENIDSLHSEDRESESSETSSEVGIVIADSEYKKSEMEDEQMRSFGSKLDEEQPGLEMGSHSSLPEEGVGVAQAIPGLLSHREWKIKETATPSYISSSMPSGIGSRFICLITYG
ncbi:unnamed protein product [Cuscuta campestris]|uniref:Uncharacterized protein n=1 Tax=Cuscuta campestris TaxID=132261 RepID=A0A484NQK1_9ASTE|nr:unnamed protein product [Cuscuta campestris]